MRGLDHSATQRRGRRIHLGFPQKLESQRGPANVDDRIHRADLVEVDLFDGNPVDFGLHLADSLENAQGSFPYLSR